MMAQTKARHLTSFTAVIDDLDTKKKKRFIKYLALLILSHISSSSIKVDWWYKET